MNLHTITDADDLRIAEPGNWWIAVWDRTRERALDYAKTQYAGDASRDKPLVLQWVSVVKLEKWPITWDVPNARQPETRPQWLRLAGWSYEDELRCDCCDLYAFGLEAYAVCQECQLCVACKRDLDMDSCELCGMHTMIG